MGARGPKPHRVLSDADWLELEMLYEESQQEMLVCIKTMIQSYETYLRLKEQCKAEFWAKCYEVKKHTVQSRLRRLGIYHYSRKPDAPKIPVAARHVHTIFYQEESYHEKTAELETV